jgi:hypothetical protein
MSISSAHSINGPLSNPPVNTYYIFVDSADNKRKAKGSGGTAATLATPRRSQRIF